MDKEKECCGGSCGCNHDHDHDHDHEQEEMMVLTLDDDTELECHVIGIFDVADSEYIALLPVDEDEVLLYKYIEFENEEFELSAIDDEAEFQAVVDVFNSLMDEMEEEEE